MNEPADSPAPQVEEEDQRQLPVLAEPRPIERKPPAPLPAVAAAAGGFVLGIATWVLVRVLRQPRPRRMKVGRGFGRRGQKVDVQATRSFLVDIHLLRDR